MKRRNYHDAHVLLKLLAWAFFWGTATVAAPALAQEVGPEGLVAGVPGADIVRAKCVLCHEAAHILRSRLSSAEWHDTLQLMINRGAPILPEEQPVILDYLGKYYSRPAN